MTRKDCNHCKHLEHVPYETSDGLDEGGWVCNKREYKNYADENSHQSRLMWNHYRKYAKKCHEPSEAKHDL